MVLRAKHHPDEMQRGAAGKAPPRMFCLYHLWQIFSSGPLGHRRNLHNPDTSHQAVPLGRKDAALLHLRAAS